MKIAYFDTISGMSGDMTLAAFISAGVKLQELTDEIKKLKLDAVELSASHVSRNGIDAVKVEVIASSLQNRHHRGITEINSIIDNSSLKESVKNNAKKIFAVLANAEAKVHGTTIDKIHFHEVGAIDSIVDIVGTAICLDLLGIEKIYSSPIKLGSSALIETEHGKLPIPSPAAVEILRDYPITLTDIPFELTTPTGAAIIKAISSGVLSFEKIKVETVGYGAGSKEIPQLPNLLRILIGEFQQTLNVDDAVVIETNIDDMNPEIYPYIVEKLLQSGALDAYLIPIIMKKGRPGILLSVLANKIDVENVMHIIYNETTTLGIRIIETSRRKIEREEKELISEKFGRVKVKIIDYEGKKQVIPEFEECKRISSEKGIPLKEVYRILEKEFFETR